MIDEQIPVSKPCRTCKEVKLLDLFPKRTGAKDGHLNECKDCIKARQDSRSAQNLIKHKESSKRFQERIKAKRDRGEIVTPQHKICSTCKSDKSSDMFYTRISTSDGLASQCKECMNAKNKIYKTTHPEVLSSSRKRSRKRKRDRFNSGTLVAPERKSCITCLIEKKVAEFPKDTLSEDGFSSKCYDCTKVYAHDQNIKHRDRVRVSNKRWAEKNEQKVQEYHDRYYQRNKERVKERCKAQAAQRRKTDPVFRLMCAMRSRQRAALQRRLKAAPSRELLGCSPILANWFLEQQFYSNAETGEEMTQENYGYKGGKRGWEYEHIIPISCVKLESFEEQRKVFHISNLQPMWGKENSKKHTKAPEGVTFEDLRKPLFTGEELKND